MRCRVGGGGIIVALMPGPTPRATRQPAVAGLFYPAGDRECAAMAAGLLRENAAAVEAARRGGPWRADVESAKPQAADAGESVGAGGVAPRRWIGGIVPHAGWVCSGAIAGETIGTIAASRRAAGLKDPDVVVVFAAVHTPLRLEIAALASARAWQVPGGTSEVPSELSGKLAADEAELFGVDDRFHRREHAVEVELPLIQRAWPAAAVLPVEVPLVDEGPIIGARTARAVEQLGLDPVYLASSDLTHYGPAYDFAPAGVGIEGLNWAKANDAHLLEVVTAVEPERVVPEVRGHMNACGGGSIAAMLAACRERGMVEARVLRHANSYEVLKDIHPQRPDNAVGYAAVVVG